jgi:hypothetical protein
VSRWVEIPLSNCNIRDIQFDLQATPGRGRYPKYGLAPLTLDPCQTAHSENRLNGQFVDWRIFRCD